MQAPVVENQLGSICLRRGKSVRTFVKLFEKVTPAIQAFKEMLDKTSHC